MNIQVPEPLTMSGLPFAPSWLNVFSASSDDEERPHVYRAVTVEWHSTGIRIISTDGFVLLTSWIPEEDSLYRPQPSFDEAPIVSFLVVDEYKRMAAMMKHLLKVSANLEKNEQPTPRVRLEVTSGEDPMVPTLGTDMDRQVLTVSIQGEQIHVPISQFNEGISWRQFFDNERSDISGVKATTEVFKKLGALTALAGHLQITTMQHGNATTMRVETEDLLETRCSLRGVIAVMKLDGDAEEAESDQQTIEQAGG